MIDSLKRAFIIPVGAVVASAGIFMSCNKETGASAEDLISTSVAVTNFQLKANALVLENLDSVFFSIDLRNQMIFNPDSLPKGTKIDALIPVVTYPSSVSAATITVTGGSHFGDQTIDYKNNPNDSVDFTGNVVLTLVAGDGVTSRDYTLKVNVHKFDPDSLVWDRMAVSSLPSRIPSPRAQKSVARDNKVYTLVEESDGTNTLAVTEDIYEELWTKSEVSLPAGSRISTLTVTPSAFYMLDDDGLLYTSQDAASWSPTAEIWSGIIGPYGDAVLGYRSAPEGFRHCHYPASADIADPLMDKDFPLSGYSNLVSSSTTWSPESTAILCGGVMADGNLSGNVWAFDGLEWVNFGASSMPPIEGCTLVPYYSYRKTTTSWIQTEFKVWMIIGGRLADGSLNRDIYLSFDNGIVWKKGDTLVSLPEYIPAMYDMDNVVITTPMEYDLSEGWTHMPGRKLPPYCRIAYKVDGYDVEWDCPYIYLIGGHDRNGALYDSIWRGVLARLTFAPLF